MSGDLLAEVEKWKGRARQGVSTPPPGYDACYVPQATLRLACEQRDQAEARAVQLEATLRRIAHGVYDDGYAREVAREALS